MFSLTRKTSRTPFAGQPPGLGQHVGGASAHERAAEARDRAEGAPAVAAAGQLERRHRSAVEAAAYGAWAARRRAGQDLVGRGGRGQPHPGHRHRRRVALDGGDRQQEAPVVGGVRVEGLAGQDRPKSGGDVGVVVEPEHGVGLGQRRGEVLAVALGQAPDGDHGAGLPAALEVGRRQERVDGVLLRRLDEAAGVHHDGLGVLRVVDEEETVGGEPTGELLGVDVVAGAAERHQGDRDVAGVADVSVLVRGGGGHRPLSMPPRAQRSRIAVTARRRTGWQVFPRAPSARGRDRPRVTRTAPSVDWIRIGGAARSAWLWP